MQVSHVLKPKNKDKVALVSICTFLGFNISGFISRNGIAFESLIR